MRKRENERVNKKFLVLLILIFISFVAVNSGFSENNYSQPSAREIKKFYSMIDLYFSNKRPSAWWIESSEPKSIEDILVTQSNLEDRLNEIRLILDEFKDASPLAARIYKSFNNSEASVYPNCVDRFGPSCGLVEFCFFPKDCQKKADYSFYYKHYSVNIRAHAYPRLVFAGAVFHELGHALYGVVDQNPSSFSATDSNAFIEEEITMYELEFKILNAGSGGKYLQYLDAYLKNGKFSFFQDAIVNVTTADINQLDIIIGNQNSGKEICGITVFQNLLVVGLRFIDIHGGGQTDKINLYRWLTKTLDNY